MTPPFYAATPKGAPWPAYVGVDFKTNFHGILTRNVLALLTGTVVAPAEGETHVSEDACVTPDGQNLYEYVFVHGEGAPEWWDEEKEGKK